MTHIRPDTDYKISNMVDGYFDRYNEINNIVELLHEKIHNPTLSADEMNVIHEELDSSIGELEKITIILEQHGYIRL